MAVVLAQDEARALGHNYIGTEHILLGTLREEEGLAVQVLGSLGITLEEARAQVVRVCGQGDEMVTGQIPFTPRAKKVLEFALREALSLGQNYIGTEHLLLGLLRETESQAVQILNYFRADSDTIRNEVVRVLVGPVRPQTDQGLAPEPESRIDLRLRRVVPVAQQLSDGTWVVSVEVWEHGLVIRWATSQRRPEPAAGHDEQMSWLVTDDVGTNYTRWTGRRSGHPKRGFYCEVEFEPAPPPNATSLRIRRLLTNAELSISLTD